ncbi:MAG: hypothetical protein J5646_06170 [Bacteroidales bacterium]|nr:hypothetical protein [Bacteroidales bacterium]
MKRVIRQRITLLALLLALAPLATWSCKQEPEVIDITVQSDFSRLVAALENVDASLSERMALLESAMQSGLADNKSAVALVRQAVQALRGSLEDKLAAVSEAVRSQGTSLETKMALIEAAIRTGFADGQAQRALLQEAIASLGGSLEEKVAALEKAVKNQSSALETKLGLIEAAFKDGLADNEAAQDLLKEAIVSLGGTLEDKLAAIDAALDSQMSGLTTKISLIETALTNGFSSGEKALQQFQTALSALKGTVDGEDEKIDAIIKTLGEMDPSTGSVSAALSQILSSVDELSSYDAMLSSILQRAELLVGRINGHAFVEMGDGLKWATCNVGATSPMDRGGHYAWGELETKRSYILGNYKWMKTGENTQECMTKYSFADNHKSGIWYDGDTYIGNGDGVEHKDFASYDYEDDVARQKWGASWRIPTFEELSGLMDTNRFDWKWTENYQGTGVMGMVVTSKIPGYESNSIFLPTGGIRYESTTGVSDVHTGYYGSSSLLGVSYNGGVILFSYYLGTKFFESGAADRSMGCTLRPVSD